LSQLSAPAISKKRDNSRSQSGEGGIKTQKDWGRKGETKKGPVKLSGVVRVWFLLPREGKGKGVEESG